MRRLRKGRELYFGYCTRSWKHFVSRLLFVSALSPLNFRVVHINVCLNRFYLLLYLFLARGVAANSIKRIYASRQFVRRMENNNWTPNTYMLFTGWEVRIGKNCDRGLNIFRQRSQFFPIRTDHKPVNNFFIFSSIEQAHQGANQRRSSAGRFS